MLIIICKYGAWRRLTPSSEPDSGAVTCSPQRILQIKDGGAHASVEIVRCSVKERLLSHDQSRLKRALPALPAPLPALLLQRSQRSVLTQREERSIRAD